MPNCYYDVHRACKEDDCCLPLPDDGNPNGYPPQQPRWQRENDSSTPAVDIKRYGFLTRAQRDEWWEHNEPREGPAWMWSALIHMRKHAEAMDDEVAALRAELAERTSERDDATRMLHGRAIAGSAASKGRSEFAFASGLYAGSVYCTGERWLAFDRTGRHLAAGLTLEAALERCREATRNGE